MEEAALLTGEDEHKSLFVVCLCVCVCVCVCCFDTIYSHGILNIAYLSFTVFGGVLPVLKWCKVTSID